MKLTEYKQLLKKPKKHKYGAKACIVTHDGTMFDASEVKQYKLDVIGIRFDSKAEANYYLHLKKLHALGEVLEIELQPSFILQESPKIKYIADFRVIWSDLRNEVIDVKGVETQAFKLKVRLFRAKFPNEKLMIIKKIGRDWIKREVS